MSNGNSNIDESKLQFENVFSLPIVQYQTKDTSDMNKELKEII